MEREQIAGRIKEFLESEFPGIAGGLTETTHLIDDFFIDSFGIINTVMFLESTFGIEVGREDINETNFQNIESLSTFVAGKLGG